jgi:hypothetical protein
MAANDFVIFDDGTYIPGSKRYKVHGSCGRTAAIKVGDLVLKGLAVAYATAWTAGGATSSAKPVVATDYVLGLAAADSTETTSANGVVDVIPNIPGLTYLGNPDDSTAWDTQTEYDALVGARVLLKYSATGVFTVLASDGSTYGVVVEPLDITLRPGKVRFSLRQGLSYLT